MRVTDGDSRDHDQGRGRRRQQAAPGPHLGNFEGWGAPSTITVFGEFLACETGSPLFGSDEWVFDITCDGCFKSKYTFFKTKADTAITIKHTLKAST